jgi:hypothetical protein
MLRLGGLYLRFRTDRFCCGRLPLPAQRAWLFYIIDNRLGLLNGIPLIGIVNSAISSPF